MVLSHAQGTALIQGSAGIKDGVLDGVEADVVFLGVGGLSRLGWEFADRYWRAHVVGTGARRVFPIHHDDFITLPFGDVRPFPALLGDTGESFARLSGLARGSGVRFEQLRFGRPVALFTATAR